MKPSQVSHRHTPSLPRDSVTAVTALSPYVPPVPRSGFAWADYREAAVILWGPAGGFAVDEAERLNRAYFDESLPPLPLVVGLTAYGHCIGATRPDGPWVPDTVPRITLHPMVFRCGTREVGDVVLHELVHVKLILAGLPSKHNTRTWCAEIERLSPLYLARTIQARPVHPRRIKGRSVRQALPGYLSHKELARWPQSCRPPGGDPGPVLAVPTY
jgi:hypothetical protein